MSPMGRSTGVVKRASFVFVFVVMDAPVPVPLSIPVEAPIWMAIILIIG